MTYIYNRGSNKEAQKHKAFREQDKNHTGPPLEFLLVASTVAASAACRTKAKGLKAVCIQFDRKRQII